MSTNPERLESAHSLRVRNLNERLIKPDRNFALYWMEHSQRADQNPALERAVAHANAVGLPCLACFVVDPGYPDGSARHFTFMLEGLAETAQSLERRGIGFALLEGSPPERIAQLARRAAVVVTDRGYLRHLEAWRTAVANDADCLVERVEGDVVVPVEVASDHAESAARTIRRKIEARRAEFATRIRERAVDRRADGLAVDGAIPLDDIAGLVASFDTVHDVPPTGHFRGGPGEARRRLAQFLAQGLPGYAERRSDLVDRSVSHLSPYLHLGQIAPTTIVERVQRAKAESPADKEAFLEELIVRRELGVNFVRYNSDYDRWSGLPQWARDTLEAHKNDERPAIHTRANLEAARSHDRYWNAAMTEMKKTGYLHNHMRMYWGKQIITFVRSPQYAYETALYLNNKYFYDGRDANSYANVGWLFGLHDRGWPERPIFGKVRSMTPSGLERKFDVERYVKWVDAL